MLRCDAMSIAVRDADRRIRIALAPDGEMHGAARVWTSPQGDAEQRAGSEHQADQADRFEPCAYVACRPSDTSFMHTAAPSLASTSTSPLSWW